MVRKKQTTLEEVNNNEKAAQAGAKGVQKQPLNHRCLYKGKNTARELTSNAHTAIVLGSRTE